MPQGFGRTGLTPEIGCGESVQEESLSANAAQFPKPRILLGMERIKQRTGHERVGPYHAWWDHEKPTGDPAGGEANQLRRDDEEPLIWVVVC